MIACISKLFYKYAFCLATWIKHSLILIEICVHEMQWNILIFVTALCMLWLLSLTSFIKSILTHRRGVRGRSTEASRQQSAAWYPMLDWASIVSSRWNIFVWSTSLNTHAAHARKIQVSRVGGFVKVATSNEKAQIRAIYFM